MDRLESIKAMLQQNPDDSFLNYAAALELKKMGDLDGAIALLTSVKAMNPQYLACYYQLGKILELAGQNEAAVKAYKEGIPIANELDDDKALAELKEAITMLED